jgi:mannitol/fructose-specific phosphotransferase system IIA component (Ntr-type)
MENNATLTVTHKGEGIEIRWQGNDKSIIELLLFLESEQFEDSKVNCLEQLTNKLVNKLGIAALASLPTFNKMQ